MVYSPSGGWGEQEGRLVSMRSILLLKIMVSILLLNALGNLRDSWQSRPKSTSNADSEQAARALAEQTLRRLLDMIKRRLAAERTLRVGKR